MARQLQQPVVVVTTSGTAVLNLAPAVAEARFQHIPLIVFTADRPRESIPQFDNQVIDQTEPFIRNSKGFYQLPAEVSDETGLQDMLGRVEAMISEASAYPEGPVHFNVPLPEPLYEPLPAPLYRHSRSQQMSISRESGAADGERIPSGTRLLVLAGMAAYGSEISGLLDTLAEVLQVVVVAENITNLHSDRFIAHPELLLHAAGGEELKKLVPDRVVAFGGQLVSRSLRLFLKEHPPGEIRILDRNPAAGLRSLLQGAEKADGSASLVGPVANGGPGPNDYLESWKTIEQRVLKDAGDYLETAPFSNLAVMHRTLSSVPAGTVLHLGNSSIVRYSQLLPIRPDLRYFSNRGTSGIDGTVSAAVGAAMVSPDPHLLVVGDLAFVYDSNAMWNKDFPDNLKIVVVNDGGGGIFRLLDGPDRMPFFEEFSVTHHPVSLELLSRSFGRDYLGANDLDAFGEKLELLFRPGSDYTVLEADTSGSENSLIFKSFLNHLHS